MNKITMNFDNKITELDEKLSIKFTGLNTSILSNLTKTSNDVSSALNDNITKIDSSITKYSSEAKDAVLIPLDEIHSSLSSVMSSLNSVHSTSIDNVSLAEKSLDSRLNHFSETILTLMRDEFDSIRKLHSDSRFQLIDKSDKIRCTEDTLPSHMTECARSCSPLHHPEVLQQPTLHSLPQSSYLFAQDVQSSHHLNFPALPTSTLSLPSTDDDSANPWNLVTGHKSLRNLNLTNPSANKSLISGSTVNNCNIRKIAGSNKSSTSKISSSSLGKWYIFVGHLSKDTSEGDLKEYLESNNINVYDVKKLSPRQTWQEKSSAFKLCINLNCKDSIMNPELWPDQSDVRDWFFKPK